MRIDYRQEIADLSDILERVIESKLGTGVEGKDVLADHWGYGGVTIEGVFKDIEVLNYIESLEWGSAVTGGTLVKPTQQQAQGAFNRLKGYLEKVHKCSGTMVYNTKRPLLSHNRYKACNYFMNQFSLQEWHIGLPDQIT